MDFIKYYVDVENTGPAWLPILAELHEGDRVALYTSIYTQTMYGSLIPALPLIRQGRLDIREGFVRGRGDSALDYFLMGEMANEVRRTPGMHAVIISNDRGYDDFISALVEEGFDASRLGWPFEHVEEPAVPETPAAIRRPAPATAMEQMIAEMSFGDKSDEMPNVRPGRMEVLRPLQSAPVPISVMEPAAEAENTQDDLCISPVMFSSAHSSMLRPLRVTLDRQPAGLHADMPAETAEANAHSMDAEAANPAKPAEAPRVATVTPLYQPTVMKPVSAKTTSAQTTHTAPVKPMRKLHGTALREYIRRGFEITIKQRQGKSNFLPLFDCGKLADAFIRYGGDFEMVLAYIDDKRRRQILGCLIPKDQRERLRNTLLENAS